MAEGMKWWDYIDLIQQAFPGYFESLTPEQKDRLRALARKAADEQLKARAWRQQVQQLGSFETWQAGPAVPEEEVPEEEVPLDELPIEEFPPPVEEEDNREDIRELLVQFLDDNGLPSTLIGFIEQALAADKPFSQIVAELRQTPEYLSAYPENQMRAANGYHWMPEAEIRAYRDEARRLAQGYLGLELSNSEVASLIAADKSLSEWERILQTWEDFERWGPTVRAVFEYELGYRIPDDRVFAFLAPFIPTPELDRAYEMALLRARPAILGLGIRPDEEAEILRRYGISVEQAFRGYQGIVAELPRAERLGAIEAEINRNLDQFPTGTELFADTPFALLFRAIQLGDPEAIEALQGQLSREVARFQAGGAPAEGGLGLLSEEERRAL